MPTLGQIFKPSRSNRNLYSNLPINPAYSPGPYSLQSLFLPHQEIIFFLPSSPLASVPLSPLLRALRRFYPKNPWFLIATESQLDTSSLFPFFNQIIKLPSNEPINPQEWNDFLIQFSQNSASIFFSLNPFEIELSELLASYCRADIRINPFEYRIPTFHNLSLSAQEFRFDNFIQSLETRINSIYHQELQIEPVLYQFPRDVAKETARFLINQGYRTQQPLIVINLQPDYEDGLPSLSQLQTIFSLIPEDRDAYTVVYCTNSSLRDTIIKKYPNWRLFSDITQWQRLAMIVLSELFITTVDDLFSLSTLFRQKSLVMARSQTQRLQSQIRQFQNQLVINLSDLSGSISEIRNHIIHQIEHVNES